MSEKITLSGVPETMLQTVLRPREGDEDARRDHRQQGGRDHRPARLRFFDGRQGRGDAQRRYSAHYRAR